MMHTWRLYGASWAPMMCVVLSWRCHDAFLELSCTPTVFSCCFYGASMLRPWCFHSVSVWCFHGAFMVLSKTPIVPSWCFHGPPRCLQSAHTDSHGASRVLTRTPMVFPWYFRVACRVVSYRPFMELHPAPISHLRLFHGVQSTLTQSK